MINITPKEEAKAAFGLTAKNVFVIMGGSMGCGRIPQLANSLIQIMPEAQVVCVCGNNKNLMEKLNMENTLLIFQYMIVTYEIKRKVIM